MSELSVNLNTTHSAAKAVPSMVIADKQLMQQIADGDDSALIELFEMHGEMLARIVGRLTGWHADADDILQEVLLKVWKSAGSYRAEGSLEGWLKRIAVNRCRNHFRTLNAIKRMIERVGIMRQIENKPTTSVYSTEPEPEPSTELQAALQKLNQKDRTVLVLYYLEEMPGHEIASSLDIKPETLYLRLHRARNKLKTLLEEGSSDG